MLSLNTEEAPFARLRTVYQFTRCIAYLRRGSLLLFENAACWSRMCECFVRAASILGKQIASLTACHSLSLAPLKLTGQVVLVGHREGQNHNADDQAAILFHHTPPFSTGR